MTKISEWRKALAAAVLGVPAWGVVAQVDGIEPVEWWGLAGVLATALVVWLVPNEAPEHDKGAVDWPAVALVAIAIVVVLWAFGEVPR